MRSLYTHFFSSWFIMLYFTWCLMLDSMGSRLWGRASALCRKVVLRAQMPERWEDQVMLCRARHWKVLWNFFFNRGTLKLDGAVLPFMCSCQKKNHLFLGQDTDIQDPYKLENLHDKWHINIVVQIMTTRLWACNAIYPVLKPDKIQLHIIQLFRY